MPVQISRHDSPAAAEADLNGRYPYVARIDVPPTDNEMHWHSFDAEFYICTGELILTDGDGKQRSCGPGDVIRIPEQTLHRETSRGGYSVVLGTTVTPDAYGDPVDRPAATLG